MHCIEVRIERCFSKPINDEVFLADIFIWLSCTRKKLGYYIGRFFWSKWTIYFCRTDWTMSDQTERKMIITNKQKYTNWFNSIKLANKPPRPLQTNLIFSDLFFQTNLMLSEVYWICLPKRSKLSRVALTSILSPACGVDLTGLKPMLEC